MLQPSLTLCANNDSTSSQSRVKRLVIKNAFIGFATYAEKSFDAVS